MSYRDLWEELRRSAMPEPVTREYIEYSMSDDLLPKEEENSRLKNLLTACYNCDSMKEVKKLIEGEIAREEV